MVIKANRLILGIMDKTPVQSTVDGEELPPLKLKVSTQAEPGDVGNIENVLIPFTTNWYQVDLKQLQKLTNHTIQLYLNVPSSGIKESVLNIYAHNLSNDVQYRINESTSTAFPADQLMRLTPASGYIEIKCGEVDDDNPTAEGVLLISNLSFIKGLNPVLNPIPSAELDSLKDLCNDLAGEHTFYDTCPINNQVAIDFAGNDDINSYTTWLDKNNINNNFVVCQLDSDFSNIRLTKASKIN